MAVRRYVVTTWEPEWVKYEWVVEVEADDPREAEAMAEALDGDIISVDRLGDYEDIHVMDRDVISVDPHEACNCRGPGLGCLWEPR